MGGILLVIATTYIGERKEFDVSDAIMKYIFRGKSGKYQIPNGATVFLKKCWAKRKCLLVYNGQEYISMVSLLRKLP